jgi:5-methylcytosine-specific restriction endonuclease McrA
MTLVSASLRDEVIRRAGGRCEYCRLSQETQVATFPVDHVLPVTEGGETVLANLALSCPRCNAGKWKRTTAEDTVSGATVPLFDPRNQLWGEHFRWSEADPTVLED